MKGKFTVLAFLFATILFVGFVLAQPSPPGGPPKVFSGSIYVNGNILPAGNYILSALINNEVVGQAKVSNGAYSGLQVSTSENFGTINFVVNGVQANETSSWNNNQNTDWGQDVFLSLNLPVAPSPIITCGNGVIDLGEECDGLNLAGRTTCGTGWTGTISCSPTCTIDYSNCTQIATTSSNSGGSGGGGGGSSGGGGGGGGSSTTIGTNYLATVNTGTNLNKPSTGNSNTNTGGSTATGVTGSDFIGSGYGVFIGVFIVVLLIAGIIVYRKKAKANRDYKKFGYKKSAM